MRFALAVALALSFFAAGVAPDATTETVSSVEVTHTSHARTASPPRVTLKGPRKTTRGRKVRLRGKAIGVHKVRIQERRARRWRTVRTKRVRNNRYVVRVAVRKAKKAKFRTVTRLAKSKKHVVKVRPVEPTPPPEPDPQPASQPDPVDACGTQPVKADGSRWQCTFHDDFEGTELDRNKWLPQLRSPTKDPTGVCYFDHPRNLNVAGGSLNLTVRSHLTHLSCLPGEGLLDSGLSLYSSGMVSTYGTFSQTYGRFEARLKVEAASGPGLQEAFWLWPDFAKVAPTEPWPASGEIDIAETFSQYWNIAVPYLHYRWTDDGQQRTAYDCIAPRGEYHTYLLEWTADRIEIFVDGTSCLVNTSGDPAFDKPYIIALTQSLGVNANQYLPLLSPPLPKTMNVDYVRVWE